VSTRDIVFIAMFAALTAVLGIFPPILLPAIGVPITAQTLGPMLAGSILGARRGALSMVLFVVLVSVGLPLLSGGRGGFGVFFGPSGGYLLGWIFCAAVVGWLVERFWLRLNFAIAFVAICTGGIGIIYLIGIPWNAAISHLPLNVVALGSTPFLIGDIIKATIAAGVTLSVRRSYPLISAKS